MNVILDHAKRLLAGVVSASPALTMLLLFAAATQAQTPTIYSPVILYREFGNPGRSFEMKEDGSGKQYLSQCPANFWGADLSHEGVQGQRHFIRIEPSSVDGQPNDLVVYPEDFSSRTVLINDKSFHPFGVVVWSRDGSRVAYTEWWCIKWDLPPNDNQCIKSISGITVADVVRDSAGMPSALVNEQRIAETSLDSLGSQTWAPDNQHLAYTLGNHAYMVDIPPQASMGTPTEIVLSAGANFNLDVLNFSPISRTDSQGHLLFTLAFRQRTETKPYPRADIFTIEIPAGYDGSYALRPVRITNSTNAKNVWQMAYFDWSPDGQWLAFDGAGGSGFTRDIYKIKSDGSAKAINLTNLTTQIYYSLNGWRK
jgi:Tol biopolymer transport system component